MDGQRGCEGVVEAHTRPPVFVIAVARAGVKGLNNRVAVAIPAQVVEVGVHFPAQAGIDGEIGPHLPVVLNEERDVFVVIIGQVERALRSGTAQRHGKQQIVVVDHAILVAVEVREILDGHDVALAEDAEVEVGINGLELAAEAELVGVARPGEHVIALQTELFGALRYTVG